MKEYMELQMSFIRKYAKHFNMGEEAAAWRWVQVGLASKFAQVYRKQFIN